MAWAASTSRGVRPNFFPRAGERVTSVVGALAVNSTTTRPRIRASMSPTSPQTRQNSTAIPPWAGKDPSGLKEDRAPARAARAPSRPPTGKILAMRSQILTESPAPGSRGTADHASARALPVARVPWTARAAAGGIPRVRAR